MLEPDKVNLNYSLIIDNLNLMMIMMMMMTVATKRWWLWWRRWYRKFCMSWNVSDFNKSLLLSPNKECLRISWA